MASQVEVLMGKESAVLGQGNAVSVMAAEPGTRFMLMAAKPYGESPIFNGPYVN